MEKFVGADSSRALRGTGLLTLIHPPDISALAGGSVVYTHTHTHTHTCPLPLKSGSGPEVAGNRDVDPTL